jgi:hypothetical protein
VYYADTADIDELGWDRFVAGAFEAIFAPMSCCGKTGT